MLILEKKKFSNKNSIAILEKSSPVSYEVKQYTAQQFPS